MTALGWFALGLATAFVLAFIASVTWPRSRKRHSQPTPIPDDIIDLAAYRRGITQTPRRERGA